MKQSANVPADLIFRARGGDERAIEELCAGEKALVTAIARKYFLTGGEVDDLVQEGMIGLYKAILSYDAKKNDCFDAYAATCIQRQILDAVRTANRDKNKPLSEGVALDALEEAAGGLSPEEEYFRNEERRRYERAKASLSEQERLILDAYLRGDSYREIAEKLGLDTKKVDNTLQRVKQVMKEKLSEAK